MRETRTETYENPTAAMYGIAIMEDAHWAVYQIVSTALNVFVVYEREREA